MKNYTTKSTNVQAAKTKTTTSTEKSEQATCEDLKRCSDAATRFMSRFNVVKLLGDCGAYKEKGVPVMVIMLYIFNLMFSPMSMYYQIKMGGFRESFSKNTVYRFLDNAHMNWHKFLLRLSHTVIRHLVGLTEDKDNRYALIVDDSPLAKRGKAMELVSKYFNHVTMGYEYGYRVLTLAWTDGCTTVPILYSLLASSYDEKVKGKIRKDIDGRSLAGRIRKLARTSMNDLTVKYACTAVKAGIPASIITFDSWFAVPHTISRLMKQTGLTVIARLKSNSKQYYEYDGKMMNIKTIYSICKKRRGKAAWKLSVKVNLLVKEKNKITERIPVERVYGIPGSNICHIHGGIPPYCQTAPIIGHGNTESINKWTKWKKENDDEFDEGGSAKCEAISNFYKRTLKDTSKQLMLGQAEGANRFGSTAGQSKRAQETVERRRHPDHQGAD